MAETARIPYSMCQHPALKMVLVRNRNWWLGCINWHGMPPRELPCCTQSTWISRRLDKYAASVIRLTRLIHTVRKIA